MESEKKWYQKKLSQLLLCWLLVLLGMLLCINGSDAAQQNNDDIRRGSFGIFVILLGAIPVVLLWRDAEKELHSLPSYTAYIFRIFIFTPLRVVLGMTCFLLAIIMISKGGQGGSNKGLGSILVGLVFYLLLLVATFVLVDLIARIAQEDLNKIDASLPPTVGFILGWKIIKRAFVWSEKDENEPDKEVILKEAKSTEESIAFQEVSFAQQVDENKTVNKEDEQAATDMYDYAAYIEQLNKNKK